MSMDAAIVEDSVIIRAQDAFLTGFSGGHSAGPHGAGNENKADFVVILSNVGQGNHRPWTPSAWPGHPKHLLAHFSLQGQSDVAPPWNKSLLRKEKSLLAGKALQMRVDAAGMEGFA